MDKDLPPLEELVAEEMQRERDEPPVPPPDRRLRQNRIRTKAGTFRKRRRAGTPV